MGWGYFVKNIKNGPIKKQDRHKINRHRKGANKKINYVYIRKIKKNYETGC